MPWDGFPCASQSRFSHDPTYNGPTPLTVRPAVQISEGRLDEPSAGQVLWFSSTARPRGLRVPGPGRSDGAERDPSSNVSDRLFPAEANLGQLAKGEHRFSLCLLGLIATLPVRGPPCAPRRCERIMDRFAPSWLPLAVGSIIAATAAASSRTITVAEPQRADLFDAAFCAAPITAHAGPRGLRLAATRTEVPPGEIKAATPAHDFADTEPPLWGGIGELTYRITTASAEAQAYFDQGLRLAFGFNHGEAQRAFRKAQKLDPTCAMFFWGEAYVLGPNINLPMQEDAIAPAFAAARRAHELAPGATPKEQALIAGLSQLYGADPKAEPAPVDAAYAAAMRDVAERFPDDNEIAAFYAEAVMDLSPWDYWRK